MATPAAVLSILVQANTAAANASLAETNAQLDATKANAATATTATSRMGSAMSKVGRIAKVSAVVGLAAFAYEAKKAVTATQDLSKTTVNLHKTLGISIKRSSEWGAALQARGADSTKAAMAFKTFATQLSGANDGSATSIAMFKKLGLSQKDISDGMTNTEGALKKVSDGLNALPGGADKATIASKLFGRGWQTIAPILRDGSAAMQDVLDTQQKYGAYLEGKTFKQQKQLLQNIKDNKSAWLGLQVQLATLVTPTLNKVSNQFQKIARITADPNLTGAERWKRVSHILDKDITTATNAFIQAIPTIAENAGKVGIKMAEGLVNGFLHADALGKLAISAWLFTKLGGASAIKAIGGKLASVLFGGSGGTVGKVLTQRGSTPANPLFVEVINQIPGGGGVPVGGKKPTIPGNEIPGWTGWGTTLGLAGVGVGTVGLAQFLSGGAALNSLKPSNLFGSNKIDPARANAQLGPRSAQVDASIPLGNQTAAINNNEHLAKSFQDVGTGAKAGIGIVDDELAGLRKKYGSLNNAAAHMSNAQKAAYVKSAKAAHENGLISRKELFKVERAFSSSVGGIHKFTGTTASIKKWSSDTVAAFHKAEGKNKDSTNSIQKWSKDTVDQFNKVMKQNKNYADQTDKTKQQVSSDVHKQDQNVSKSYDHMAVVSGKGMETLKNNTNSALKGLGVGKSIDFSTFTLSGTPGAHQRGGMISGGTPGKDSVHSLLEPGEFVMNARAVKNIGAARLEAMNKAIPRFQKGGKVGGGMGAMIAEANKFEQHHFPYAWGGGHSGFGIQPVDCSGAVSDVLHAAGLLSTPMVSGSLMSWGKPGRGPLTVYANPEHTVMSLDGRTFGTSGSNPGGGAGWIEGASGASLAPGAIRTMDVGAAISKIKRQIIKGPRGALGGAAQMSLDHVWHGANRYLAKHTPGGSFGGGQAAAMGKGKMFTASWYPGGVGGSGHRMDSHSFAEVGWSDQGNGELNGALGGLPYGTAVAMSRAGKSGSFTKWDVGTGGGGIGGTTRAVDFPAAAASWFWPSYASDGLTQVKVAVPKQRGGLIPSFGGGGIVPGGRNQAQPIIAHGGEKITRANENRRYAITITNWKDGTGHMEEIADGAVNGQRRLSNQLSRMRR